MTDESENQDPDAVDEYFDALTRVHELFGYKQDWRVIPLDDARGLAWMLVGGEGVGGTCVHACKEGVEITAATIAAGSEVASGPIYTQRFLPKWVYRTDDYVMVAVDTQCDGNKLLMVFDAALEVTDDALRAAWVQHWGSG